MYDKVLVLCEVMVRYWYCANRMLVRMRIQARSPSNSESPSPANVTPLTGAMAPKRDWSQTDISAPTDSAPERDSPLPTSKRPDRH